MNGETTGQGTITRIAGPVVGCVGLGQVRLYDVVYVGRRRLIGEVIRLDGAVATLQVYEDTTGVRVGEPVVNSGFPLNVTLGPGLLGSVYDGLQRPLTGSDAPYLTPGSAPPPLPTDRTWEFNPLVAPRDVVTPGDRLGYVDETPHLRHYILAPPGAAGSVVEVHEGRAGPPDPLVRLRTPHGKETVTLTQQWPVRRPRPVRRRLKPSRPLITGMRVIDTFFPVARGGTAIIPGGFGTGKTVTEQSLARWAAVDIVIYVGCGERGNEMADVLQEFPQLEDPRYGAPLMARTVLIANTSNMPVAARVTSVYTGMTIAEYYRDMGYDVLLLADSTSRWAEALREISSRLEEMPGEEGYPAYLGARLATFYERAGRVETAPWPGEMEPTAGSITVVGAVSPPGGDFSEPMTQNSLRVAGAFWAMDRDLAHRRHFPAINWLQSYTLYDTTAWFAESVAPDWPAMVRHARHLLQEEEALQEIVQLVGPDTLAAEQQLLLAVARLLREDFLQQHAFDEIDRYCPPAKGAAMLRAILTFDEAARAALDHNVPLAAITALPVVAELGRMKQIPAARAPERLAELLPRLKAELARLYVPAEEEGP